MCRGIFSLLHELLSALGRERGLKSSLVWERTCHREPELSRRGEGTSSPEPNQSRTIAPPPRTLIEIENVIWNGFCFLDAWNFRIVFVFDCSSFILFDLLISCISSLLMLSGICRGAFSHRHGLLSALG